MAAAERNFRAASERLESLLRELDAVDEPAIRRKTAEVVDLVTEIHGVGLGRLFEILEQDQASERIISSLCKDSLVASLLGLHNLHPASIETRVTEALDRVRPHLGSWGGAVEFVKVENGFACVRLSAGGNCSSLSSEGKLLVQKAIEEAVPEIEGVEIEGPGRFAFPSAEGNAGDSGIAAQGHRGAACELCGSGIGDLHRHIAEIERRKILCACRACSFLFDGNKASRARYRTVPLKYLDLTESAITAAEWEELEIPIGVAFFFFNSALNRMVACYPGPAGATESLLSLQSWSKVVRAHPVLQELAPDVEALLVDKLKPGNPPRCHVVPIDACYELVARLRRHWRGFDGGDQARREIDRFFNELRLRSMAP